VAEPPPQGHQYGYGHTGRSPDCAVRHDWAGWAWCERPPALAGRSPRSGQPALRARPRARRGPPGTTPPPTPQSASRVAAALLTAR
jgi:hypothetical protein